MDIKAIIERLKTDKEFAAKYARLSSIDTALDQAKKDGFDATREDIMAVLRELGKAEKKELSEDELTAVAGGTSKAKCRECGGNTLVEGALCIFCAAKYIKH